jgi:hypothetical protein
MRFCLILLLSAVITLSGCGGTSKNVNSNFNSNANNTQSFKPPEPIKPVESADPNFKPCNPYFPLVPGSVAKYVINYSSGLVADLTVVTDAAEENGRKVFTERSQIVDRSGGMQIVQSTTRKFVCVGDRIQILSEKNESNVSGQQSSSEFEYRENSLMMTDPKSMLTKGSTWSHALRPVFHKPGQAPSRSDTKIISFEVLGPQDITTPVGTFKTIRVLRKVDDNTAVDYFAPGLGLVRREAKEGNRWEIKEYSGLSPQQ